MPDKIDFIGEHLTIGNIGHLSIVLSFTLSLLSAISYYFATVKTDEQENASWLKLARYSFLLQVFTVASVFFSLFYIIYNHYYEYHYAWSHSSNGLPVKYMISCFWGGQEGSFLLWIVWQAVLGALLIWKAPRSWEKPVMAIIALSQVMLTSMILGSLIGNIKIGSSPFTLLREAMADAPIFHKANYLESVKDGSGLNPLLQNNWMVIHPPTLFFGFASTVVPFAFALAGLWQKRYTEWIKPALPWALVSLCVLGIGIIMGAAWAYESLTFGGYWNWDPVENASILPWLILAAGVHSMVIYNSTQKTAHTTILMIVLTFLSVLYATFLTRSGILGDSSVHSFTDLGLSGQLLIWLFVFIILSAYLIIKTWKQYQSNKDEDRLSAREFWMFIGSLVLLLSAIHIVSVTSIPVYNKVAALFGIELKMAPPANRFDAYHFVQIPVAVLIALGSAFAQYLKYRKTASMRSFFLKMGITFGISLLLGGFFFYYFDLGKIIYGLLLTFSLFSIFANVLFMFDTLKGNIKSAGAAVTHIGFALMMVGVIFSSVNKTVISQNNTSVSLGDETANRENVLLEKNLPLRMNNYIVTYLSDSNVPPNIYYKVNYKKVDEHDQIVEEFTLHPNAQINPQMGLIANPDTKHYFTHDVFTHVTTVPKNDVEGNDTAGLRDVKMHWVSAHDTIFTGNGIIVFDTVEILTNTEKNKYGAEYLLGAKCKIYTNRGETYEVEPLFGARGNEPIYIDGNSKEAGILMGFLSVNPDNKQIQLGVGEKTPQRDFIIMKAIVFPYINLLWAGSFLFGIGTMLAFYRRMKLAWNLA